MLLRLTTLILLTVATACAQLNNRSITLIPTTNSSGVPTATGEMNFRDLGTGGALHLFTIHAPDTITASYSVKAPVAQGIGALTNDGSGNLTWDSTGGAIYFNVRSYGAVCDGTTDDSTAIQAAITAAGDEKVLIPGSCAIASSLTVGNGSSGGASSVHGTKFVGFGAGYAGTEVSGAGASSQLVWIGSAGGTMLIFNGPIANVGIEGVAFECKGVTNAAALAIDAEHAFNSIFRDIVVRRCAGNGISVQAYASVSGTAIGANQNLWENIKIISLDASASGLLLGAASYGSSPHLDVASNTFINLTVQLATSTGNCIHLRFTDNITFKNLSCIGGLNGIYADAPSGNTAFPLNITCYQCALFADNKVANNGWTGTQGVYFIPYINDGNGEPSNAFVTGIWSSAGPLSVAALTVEGVVKFTGASGSGVRCIQTDNAGLITKASALCFPNPMTTTGDLIYSSSGSTPARLGISGVGGTNFLVQLGSSTPTWQNIIVSSPLAYSSGIFSIQVANTSQNGYLSSSDWNTFNGKLTSPMTTAGDLIVGGSGGAAARLGISGVGGTNFLVQLGSSSPSWQNIIVSSPLGYSSGVFSIQVSTSGQNGYLSSTDWSTFNGKMTNPMTTTGDLIYSSSGSTPARLGISGVGGTNFLVQLGAANPTWQNILVSSPLSYSSGVFACASCVTTTGTFSLAGGYTVTGNFYNRTFSGAPSCSGVADGWQGYDTTGNVLYICGGGTAHAH